MSIFSSQRNRGSAVLASMILAAAAGIAGVILTAFGTSQTSVQPVAQVNSQGMVAAAAATSGSAPIKDRCNPGEERNIKRSKDSIAEPTIGKCWEQPGAGGACGGTVASHLNQHSQVAGVYAADAGAGYTCPGPDAGTPKCADFKTKPKGKECVDVVTGDDGKNTVCETNPDGTKGLCKGPDGSEANYVTASDIASACGGKEYSAALADSACGDTLSDCKNNPATCGTYGSTVSTCAIYPSTPGCADINAANGITDPCAGKTGSDLTSCTTENESVAPKDTLSCIASGATNCGESDTGDKLGAGADCSGDSSLCASGTCGSDNKCTAPAAGPGATCNPACTGGQQCVGGTCQTPSPAAGPGYQGNHTQAGPNAGNGQTGSGGSGSSMPSSGSGSTNGTGSNSATCLIGSLASSLITGSTYQSVSCATNQSAYQQQQYNYQNQMNTYNNCRMQAAYAQQSGQCPQQCQMPQVPPAPCYSTQQSSPYGVGTDGNACSQPPTQPDPSQCTNGSFRPLSATQNGCVTGWQCVPTSCGTAPQQPDPSGCTAGTWNAIYSGNSGATVTGTGSPSGCIIGWQCVNGNGSTGPQASLSCSPTTADVGTVIAFNYSCTNSVTSTGNGFTTNNQMSGTASSTLAAPPTGTNTATYTLACSDGNGNSAGASCAVQVANPKIVLVANPASVSSGEETTIGWITSGMKACTIASPEDSNFTSFNANNTSINGVASTSPITQQTDYVLTCTTLGGNTKIATTTVTLTTSMNSFFKVALHFLHLG